VEVANDAWIATMWGIVTVLEDDEVQLLVREDRTLERVLK